MKNKKLRNLIVLIIIILIFALILIRIKSNKVLTLNKKTNITIYDNNGNEYYKIDEPISINSESEMLINSNGVVDSIILQVVNDIENEKQYSKEEAIKFLNNGEYSIYSTIDRAVQKKLNDSFNDRSTFTSTKKCEFNQGAMVIMDYDGNVIAVVSGNNEDNSKNRASTTLLKVGSTIKPVAIYSPAIDKNIVNFSTIIDDIPGNTFYNGQAIPWPTNYDNKYESNLTITDALMKSKNTVAVTVGEMVGEEQIFKFLKYDLGYSTLIENESSDDDKQLAALALGYFQQGITLDTLVASYSMIGNGGYYSGKTYYKELKDNEGNIIISKENEKKRVITEETATIMNRLLLNNIIDENSIIKNIEIDGIEALGKTGTVGNDEKENISQLFVGMTPDYIAGVWVGYDDERALLHEMYKSPTEIWQNVMSKMEFENSSFQLSDNVYKLDYCSESGLLKSDYCKNIKTGYYKKENMPTLCNSCK